MSEFIINSEGTEVRLERYANAICFEDGECSLVDVPLEQVKPLIKELKRLLKDD